MLKSNSNDNNIIINDNKRINEKHFKKGLVYIFIKFTNYQEVLRVCNMR